MSLDESARSGVNSAHESSSGEHYIYVGTAVAHIQLVEGEPVSTKMTTQIKGRVSISEYLKMLNADTLRSYEGDGVQYPIETTEEVYPRKERVRKSGRKKKKQELEGTAAASYDVLSKPSTRRQDAGRSGTLDGVD